MSDVVAEIRNAYARFGMELDGVATYGTYYRLRCGRCGHLLGNIGDKLLPGMAEAVLNEQFELYAAGLLGCACGYQAECARQLDGPRADIALAKFSA